MLMLMMAAAAALNGVPTNDQKMIRTIAPVCQQDGPRSVSETKEKPHGGPLAQTLDKEPAADAYSAVLHTQGACSKPMVVSRDIGMNPKAKGEPATR